MHASLVDARPHPRELSDRVLMELAGLGVAEVPDAVRLAPDDEPVAHGGEERGVDAARDHLLEGRGRQRAGHCPREAARMRVEVEDGDGRRLRGEIALTPLRRLAAHAAFEDKARTKSIILVF